MNLALTELCVKIVEMINTKNMDTDILSMGTWRALGLKYFNSSVYTILV